jgi:DNA-binding NarL/FixJ family response regulator
MPGSSSGAAHAQRRETPKTILVADDDPAIRKALCEMFEIEEDYDICAEAVNGQEAIALAEKHRPDLVILDLSMPVMNGYDAAWEIRRILPNTRIILFTLYADAVKSRVLGSGSPVDLVVSKTDSANMMNHVRSLIPVRILGFNTGPT